MSALITCASRWGSALCCMTERLVFGFLLWCWLAARRTPPVTLLFPMLHRDPPEVSFKRISVTVRAHARQCDPLPALRLGQWKSRALFCKISCAMLSRSSCSCSNSLQPSRTVTLARALSLSFWEGRDPPNHAHFPAVNA